MTSEPRRENRPTEMRQDRFSPAGAQSTGTVAVRRLRLIRLPRRRRHEHDRRIHALAPHGTSETDSGTDQNADAETEHFRLEQRRRIFLPGSGLADRLLDERHHLAPLVHRGNGGHGIRLRGRRRFDVQGRARTVGRQRFSQKNENERMIIGHLRRLSWGRAGRS